MESLTVNQIMILLDIHRGPQTQHVIGTYEKDKRILSSLGLINDTTPISETTPAGEKLIELIKKQTKPLFLK